MSPGVRAGLVIGLLLGAIGAWAQSVVNQGAPGKQGPWPVTISGGGFTGADGGGALIVAPVQCRATALDGGVVHQIMQVGVNAIQIPATPAAGRVYVNVCSSLQNTSTILIKCRADSTAPVYNAGATGAGDVLAVGDCVTYTAPTAANVVQCITNIDAGNYVDTYECVP